MTVDGALKTLSVELVMEGRKALVVGACRECALKVPRLLASGAVVRVVADGHVEPEIEEAAARGELSLERRPFADEDWNDVAVTFVSPELEALGARLADEARRTGRLVSTLDRPESCTFVNPAVVVRHGLKIAISSGGVAPALLRRVREELERGLDDPRLGELVRALAAARRALSRGERTVELKKLVEGFSIELALTFPEWLGHNSAKESGKVG